MLYLQRDITYITECAVVVRIMEHLKLTFVAAKPPPAHVFEPVAFMASFRGTAGFPHMSKPCFTRGRGPPSQ
jgi:hypothetical protein